MAYSAALSPHFIKMEKRIPQEFKDANYQAIEAVLGNPYCGKPLHGGLKGLWSIRFGKYRKLYEIVESERVVRFYAVDERKRVYKR